MFGHERRIPPIPAVRKKWITQERLSMAQHKITAEKSKIVDAYHSLGSENFADFSFAMNKALCYSSSALKHEHP